jgi:hypothetical protein
MKEPQDTNTDETEQFECEHLWMPYKVKYENNLHQTSIHGKTHSSGKFVTVSELVSKIVTAIYCQKCLKIRNITNPNPDYPDISY